MFRQLCTGKTLFACRDDPFREVKRDLVAGLDVVVELLADDGDNAPYNGETEYSINTDKAEALGFGFSDLKDWIYELIDYYIGLVRE